MINPKYKNMFMAPDVVGGDIELSPNVEHDEPSAKEPLVVNGHTINSKLGGTGRTIAETLRKANRTDGQTIGGATVEAGSGSGGGELKVVYESYIDEEAEGGVHLIRCDHTHTEIMSALDAGKRVTADFVDGLDEYGNLIVTSNMDVIIAMNITYSAGTCTIGVLAHDSDDIIIEAGVVDLFA